ncbi:MAG: hypothetical protein K1X42_16715 [Opitutaceae bacterium]|nr:hypothetical protein [Opitutaceae bacterium]
MSRRPPAIILALFGIVSSAFAADPVRIYIANDDHTDLLWTADEETYAKAFIGMLDFHLKLADDTAANPPPYRNRFNCDGSYWIWNYEQRKSPEEFARLIARIREGTISVPLNLVVSCYGGQPLEAILRGMAYSGRLEREHGLHFPLAVAMENQTLPLGLASVFAGCGARYSWRGVCACGSRLPNAVLQSRPREISWWTGHDGQRLLLKWHSLTTMEPAQNSGGYAEAFDPVQSVQYLDSDPVFLSRYRQRGSSEPYHVRGAFGFGEDALDRKTGQPYTGPQRYPYPVVDHFHLIAERMSNDHRQVIVSNELDFFEDFERTHGNTLETQAVTYGNEWDLNSTARPDLTARAKRAVERLRGAELLATLASLHGPDLMQELRTARDQANNALGLFWEHNWMVGGGFITRAQRAAWQEELASRIEAYVNTLQQAASERLGQLIPQSGKSKRFFVLNPLGSERTDVADFPYDGATDIHVCDLKSDRDVPHQIIERGGKKFLRILASNLPAAGYKVYELRPGPGSAPTDDAARFYGATFENDVVRLVIEQDGAIRSLIDRRANDAELAANIGGLRLNDFAANTDEGEPLVVENRGPVSVTVRARSAAGLQHTTAITLYRDSDRVDIENEIDAELAGVKHWAFSFAFDHPAVHSEEVGAINLNKRQSEGGDYSDTHARYDYISANHFADITDGSGKKGVTISNADLAFVRLGVSTPASLDTVTPQLHFLASGPVDGHGNKREAQPPNPTQRFTQCFALRPHRGYNATAAMSFALEHQNPPLTGAVEGAPSAPLPSVSHSLLTVDDPDVLLWAAKPSYDGIDHGIVVRLWNVSNRPVKTTLFLTPGLTRALRTTHLESNLEPVALANSHTIPMTFARQQIQTYRLISN